MKKANQYFAFLLVCLALFASGILTSCSKNNSVTSTPPPPAPNPPANPGHYRSSWQISASTLAAYFPFEGSYTDTIKQLEGTNHGANFGPGLTGQAYVGVGQSYVTYSGVPWLFRNDFVYGYTISAWFKISAQPIADNGTFQPTSGSMGIFSMYDNETGYPNVLLLELEPYTPVSGDSVRVHAGFNNFGNDYAAPGWTAVIPEGFLDTAIGKWTQVVMTYDGESSKYTLYENGTAIAAKSPWTSPTDLTPFIVLNGPTGWRDSSTNKMGYPYWPHFPTGFIIGGWPYNSNVSPNFGSQPWAGYFQGSLDNVRIYTSALNSDDVKSLYILEKAGF
jgi:hypothetical protein